MKLQPDFNQTIKELEYYGYAIVKNYLSQNHVQKLLELINSIYEKSSHAEHSGKPERDSDKYVYNLQGKSEKFIELLGSDFVESVLKHFLNDPYYRALPAQDPNYILSYFNARSSGPKLELHMDTAIPSQSEKTWIMQIAFPLERFSKSNGCTFVVPGSHKSGRYVDRELEKLTYLECAPGDLVIWDSRIWHGTSENIDKVSRWALIATMSCWWVKQRSDVPRTISQVMYQQLTDKQKSLLGFCSIPPADERVQLTYKSGYDSLKKHVSDYFI